MATLPREIKKDKHGLLYIDNKSVLKKSVCFEDYNGRDEWTMKSLFYEIKSTEDYIVKISSFGYNKNDCKKIIEMLKRFDKLRKKIPDIDFPIGYIKGHFRIIGMIIRYYQESISLHSLSNNYQIDDISKIYLRSDDKLTNLFDIFYDVLRIIEVMYENKVYYYDVNIGNFVIFHNSIKVIDFEQNRVRFTSDEDTFSYIVINYLKLVRQFLEKFRMPLNNLPLLTADYNDLNNKIRFVGSNFDDVRCYVKKIENNIRRG